MASKVLWCLVRLSVVLFIFAPVAYSILILIETSRPRFLGFNWDAYIWLSVLLLVLGYVLFRSSATKEFGKLFIISVVGVSVLLMYEGYSYDFGNWHIAANTIFVGILFIISAIYFVFPSKWLKPALFLLPVSALTWFLRMSVYQPICFSYEVYLSRVTMTPEQMDRVIELLAESYVTMLIGGSMSAGLLIPYFFALYASNPRRSYISLTRQSR